SSSATRIPRVGHRSTPSCTASCSRTTTGARPRTSSRRRTNCCGPSRSNSRAPTSGPQHARGIEFAPGHRSGQLLVIGARRDDRTSAEPLHHPQLHEHVLATDRKSTRLNSSHVKISYAVFCLKKKKYVKVTVFYVQTQ